MRGDDGSFVAFEGILIALLVLGALLAAATLRQPPDDTGLTHRQVEVAARDALLVLDNLREDRGRLLDVSMAEAFDCAFGRVPPDALCDGTRPNNLSRRLEGYLPPGAAYAIALHNGVDERELHRKSVPRGETVSASHAFTPDWNVTFVASDLSCHDRDMKVNVSMVPIYHGRLLEPLYIDALTSAASVNATASPTTGVWNATLPVTAVGLPVVADVDAREGNFFGTTAPAVCELGSFAWPLRDGLNLSRASALGPRGDAIAPLGAPLTLTYDFSAISSLVPGATLQRVEATVFDPVPGRPAVADAFVVSGDVALGSAWSGSAEWEVPEDALLGVHPILLTADLSVVHAVGVTEVQVRLVTWANFALPSGVVPFEPPYRAVLEAWLPDWS